MTAQSLDLDSAPPYQSLPGYIFCYGCKDPSFHYPVSCPLYPCKPLPWDRRWNDHRDIPEAAVSILTPEPPQMPSALWCLGARNFPHEQKWETFFFSIYWFQREREREKERETSISCFTYLCIYWLIFVCALTRNKTHNLGVSGQCSNPVIFNLFHLLTYIN